MSQENTVIDDIGAVIGTSAATALAAWFGDKDKLYIPKVVEDGQMLVKIIGFSAAKRLSEEWPGELLAVPRLSHYDREKLRHAVYILVRANVNVKDIAKLTNVGRRRIQQICREMEQLGLIEVISPGKMPQENPQEKCPGKNLQEIMGSTLPGKWIDDDSDDFDD